MSLHGATSPSLVLALVHSFIKYLLSVHYVLGTGDIEIKGIVSALKELI